MSSRGLVFKLLSSSNFLLLFLFASIPEMSKPMATFYGLYVGQTPVISLQERQVIKVASREVLDRKQSLVRESKEVDIVVADTQVLIVYHKTDSPITVDTEIDSIDPSTILVKFDYKLMSNLFILREDEKVLSIMMVDPPGNSSVYVFMLTNVAKTNCLSGIIFDNCKKVRNLYGPHPVILSDDEVETHSDAEKHFPPPTIPCILDF